MKRVHKLLLFTLFSFFVVIPVALAAPSISTSVSSSSIEVGKNVTFYVTLRNVASWNIQVSGIGSTNGCSMADADASQSAQNVTKTFSVTCKGTNIGMINFSVSGDATSSDGSNINLSGDKRVNVTAARPKSTNNYLSSIQVGEYSLTPEFDKDTLEYSLTVPSTTNTVTIEAKAADGYASVEGTGEFEVDEGANVFSITVHAENGDERIYQVTVNVEDQNPIRISMDGGEYTVVKNVKHVTKPDLYEASTVQINGFEIPCYVSEVTNYILVVVKSSTGDNHFAIYDQDHQTYQLYEEQKSQSLILYVMKAPEALEGFHETTILINDVTYPAFKINDNSDFALVYAMNIETGDKNYYLYNQKENTYQLYFDEMANLLREENHTYKNVILVFACACIFLILLCAFAFLRKPKVRKIVEKKKEKDVVDSEQFEKWDLKKEKKQKKTSSQEENIEKEEKTDDSKKTEEPMVSEQTGVVDVQEALDKMNRVEDMILAYEQTMALSQKEIQKIESAQNKKKEKNSEAKEKTKKENESKESTEKMEQTMYDLFEDEKKKKKVKK